eukprot:CAMPEP_0185017246 /NCGR_PEP_ID=MMETSP1103-20130426/218_1 /TAXON_ID=36769 /ORGANISM="Paraphysomonas bandaiensis, Strain Caron Lab Isolate" /LENGTH=120 /DNA_ID=CAMNT_0027546557 /DNA_START=45 /DNA_END=407 /DNA_ORIENTATION=+
MVKEGTKRTKAKGSDIATRDYTIHMSKRLYGVNFKKRAPRAIAEIKKFATKAMGTKNVRVDTMLNKHIWSQGVRNVPKRIRVRLERRRDEDEEATEKLYTLVKYVQVADFHGLQTTNVEA